MKGDFLGRGLFAIASVCGSRMNAEDGWQRCLLQKPSHNQEKKAPFSFCSFVVSVVERVEVING